jgi:hypothetical protein
VIKNLALIMGVVLSVSCFQSKAADFVEFKRSSKGHSGNRQEDRNSNQDIFDSIVANGATGTGKDADIVAAVTSRHSLNFVKGGGMVVVKLLPDDTNGLQHQKWIVRLSNGSTMQAVYNLDMCEYVQLKVGDVISMGGQFIWTKGGGLLHWLHFDPREKRPDGFVEVNGKVYCGDGARHQ